ncbi:reprolysin-like metallopeptidase [uncultured Maribacter sp.]|uniref:zinc-dependent metalloprotease n=1 Tax=uncultured Maribacter sp. TaxID=431308 RepID=UPI00261D26A3|nr:zinc-dependent metalloprotease family protein [uncultured Maribacter sp.]
MLTKLRLLFSITIVFLSFYGSAQSNYWKQEVSSNSIKKAYAKQYKVKKGKTFTFNASNFKSQLKSGVHSKNNGISIYLPNENGVQEAFLVKESSVLSPILATKYPNIKSYTGYSINNPQDKVRFSISHKGIQSMVVHGNKSGNTYIEHVKGNTYVSYKRDKENKTEKDFICKTKASITNKSSSQALRPVDDQKLRKYRLAVSTTGEYTTFHGGTVTDALAAINATVTRLNQVFETDLAITLELVSNTDEVIYTDPETDPYDGNLNTQTQSTLSSIIEEENYDIGHLFHLDAANGNAGSIGSVCQDGKKGSAFSSHPNPTGDLFDLDYVAHEMGHQFGANHTWSHESEGTLVQVEPGSGTTIMGYAGIVGDNNVASNGDGYFHYWSIVQIVNYVKTTNCAVETDLTNLPPTITLTGNFTIPKSTPFVLTGNATDTDPTDVLTYTWEQIDNGVITQATFGPTSVSGANFRSQIPSTSPERYFPKLSSILTGQLTQTMPTINSAWETLSEVERELNFALTVRDNASGGGQVVTDLVEVSVSGNAGPFKVTSQTTNEVLKAGSTQTILWDVANTDKAPINTTKVDILLSTDGGLTYPITLSDDVVNDGEHKIIIPGVATTQARVMVKASNSIYFAINDTNFTIEESEVVLNFTNLEYEVCSPGDVTTTFNYETYLGFSEESTFSVTSPPPGLGITFSPETATLNDTEVTISFTNIGSLTPGTYPIEIVSTATTQTKTVVLELNIFDNSFNPVILQSPINGIEDTSKNITLEWESNPEYTSYDIEIATDDLFTTIIDSKTLISNTYSPLSLSYETTYYWRVKPKNVCGEGTFSEPFSFSTIKFSCKTKSAVGLPLEISAEGTPTVNSKISFFEDINLSDINVSLEIDHNYLSDIVVNLISPQGTKVALVSSSCGDLKNINATFDDDANSFTCGGNPAINGTVKPLGSLSSLIGESIKGDWTLQINDNASDDGGFLKAFYIEVCVEGEFRPDEDNDGVFDDGDDLCLGTPEGLEVDENGCTVYLFPNTNFAVSTQSEACRNSNDGQISIDATLPLEYTIVITGDTLNSTDNFNTNNYTLNNLSAGEYTICITGTDGNITYNEHCFTVSITEPEALNVSSKAAITKNTTTLFLSGSNLYNIELNGIVTQTTKSEIDITLKEGTNTLKVYTNIPCQGVHEENIFISSTAIMYPNPMTSIANLYIGTNLEEVAVKIFSNTGQLIKSKTYNYISNEIELDLSSLPIGIYFVSYSSKDLKGTLKVIKQ